MSLNNFGEKANFIWSIADLIRDVFRRSKYQDVILPFTVLRRLDCVLAPTKEDVFAAHREYGSKLEKPGDLLRSKSGFAFYNISRYDFRRLMNDPPAIADNLRDYIHGFSDNMREVLERFDFINTINKLDETRLLYLVMECFNQIDLHPDVVSNLEMGYVFEELIRKFNEAMNENPGEHFTPREVVRLMVNLLLAYDADALSPAHIARTICDPCCGTGGMLTLAKDRIMEINPLADVFLFGQEVNPETFAVCKSDLYMKSADGRDAEYILYGSTLANDRHASRTFDYQLANPPYGKDWKMDLAAVMAEARRGYAGRFGAGTPRISDGQLLFLQHMLSKMKEPREGGGRVAIVMNGSPLFTGDAGSGESEIRRWILENDWLEALVALPEQLFYNTGISTYIWILSNHKPPERKGKVQLIDASGFWTPMRKSMGDKRREIAAEQIEEITAIYTAFEPSAVSKIFDNAALGYRKITVERPLRLSFLASAERIARLDDEHVFQNLAVSKKKKDKAKKAAEEEAGRAEQQAVREMLARLPSTLYTNRAQFAKALSQATKAADLKLSTPIKKAILAALSEKDPDATICHNAKGQPEPDTALRDYESVPLGEDVDAYFAREVTPHVPDAWISGDKKYRDHKDGERGKVGYEINFNRYFYTYTPPRPLEAIEADIKALEGEIMAMLKEVTE